MPSSASRARSCRCAGTVLSSSGQRLQVMLGEGLARSLKAGPGSGLTLMASTTEGVLNALDVTVAGVFSTGVPDSTSGWSSPTWPPRRSCWSRSACRAWACSSTAWSRPHRCSAAAAACPRLQVQTWVDQAVFYRSVRDLYNRIFGALGLIIGVIVVFVVANAMAMAVIERTREVGTLRALGTLPGQLVRSFALEGLLLGGVGAAWACRAGAGRDRCAAGLSGADAAASRAQRGLPAADGLRRVAVRGHRCWPC
jgi:putative ABC transport system permease protein